MTEKAIGRALARQKGFTLAEVLITLVVIGVVAAITVPVVMNNVQQKVKQERVSNIRHKFSKATDAMLVASGMNGYTDTMDFVQTFKRHLKIAKICDTNHIADCWPTQTVTAVNNGTSTTFDISTIRTSANLRLPQQGVSIDWADPVGIITADGTSMILSYNKKCNKYATDGTNWSGDISSSSTCVSAVFDWNGGKKPNRLGDAASGKNNDIFGINAYGLGDGCLVFKVGGKCMGTAFKPINLSDWSDEYREKLGIKIASRFSTDLWGGAVETCGYRPNLLGLGNLNQLQNALYKDGKFYNRELALAMGMPNSSIDSLLNNSGSIFIWTSDYNADFGAYAHSLKFTSSGISKAISDRRNNITPFGLCMGS